jgi:flagellar hook assembly protein FlgD
MPKTAFYLISANDIDDEYLPIVKLLSCYPNPFSETVTLSLNLAKREQICLEIYNCKGQKVTTLYNGNIEKGETKISWNGLDSNNRKVANGLYIGQLRTKEKCEKVKLIVLK